MDTVISKDLEKSPNFVMHAKHFVKMVNQALELLGPDVELLTDILLALGQKHVVYGVQPEVRVLRPMTMAFDYRAIRKEKAYFSHVPPFPSIILAWGED